MLNLTEISRNLKVVNRMLDKVEVRGHENLDILLGSMNVIGQAIEQLDAGIQEMEKPSAEELKKDIPAE